VPEITEAYEWLYTQQKRGAIDTKRADGLNTTLKGVQKLRVEIPLKLADLIMKAQLKKVDLPEGLLPKLAPDPRALTD
jgi:hypothetical protein